MAKTDNLNLELTDSNQLEFLNWRKAINGNGSGENKSNTQLIDEFAGKFAGGTERQYCRKMSSENFDTGWETADAEPTENSDKLVTSGGVQSAIETAKSFVDTGRSIVVSASGSVSQELSPSVFYAFNGAIAALSITLGASVANRENEYKGQFLSGSTAISVTFPSGISWIGGMPAFEANKTYQFSILNGIGVIVGV